MRIRHALPQFGRVPTDLWRDSSSGIVRSAITIATRQAMDTANWVQLIGLNRDMGRMHYTLDGVDVRTTRGWDHAKWGDQDWRYTLPVLTYALQSPADVLHVHDNPFLLWLPRTGRRILHFHTPITGRASEPFVRAARQADRVICNSGATRADFLASVPYPSHRAHVVHNAVDMSVFHTKDRGLRAELGIPDSVRVLLFVGQISWEKGLIHLIRALPLLRTQCTLLVAGSTDLWQTVQSPTSPDAPPLTEYEQEIRREAAGLPVRFLGKVATDGLARVYAACDVFVCPSEWPEPFGMVNVEAMAAGKPVVASNVGGIPEIVVDGETGVLVKAADPESLACALDDLLVDEGRLGAMGEAGLQRARSVFTWDNALKGIQGIYGA